MARYVYLGDKLTDPRLVGQPCDPVLRADGTCLVSQKPRNQLVVFTTGEQVVVLGRRLRLTTSKDGAPCRTAPDPLRPAPTDGALGPVPMSTSAPDSWAGCSCPAADRPSSASTESEQTRRACDGASVPPGRRIH